LAFSHPYSTIVVGLLAQLEDLELMKFTPPEVKTQTAAALVPGQEAQAPARLGEILKRLRGSRDWTLADAAKATGIARSSLSKIENGLMSPTYDLIQRLARGYGVDIVEFFGPSAQAGSTGRMAVTRVHEGQHHETPLYDHEVLAAALTRKKMQPFRSRIKAHGKLERIDWASHGGEEFLLVLEGSVIFYTEHYEPVKLETGDSIYIDSSMQHACVSTGDRDAEVLWMAAE
jgi:transcriptional regulator with XRE-family HTH domain